MSALPPPTPVTAPVPLTVTTAESEDCHVANGVTVIAEPSESVAVACIWVVSPRNGAPPDTRTDRTDDVCDVGEVGWAGAAPPHAVQMAAAPSATITRTTTP